MRETSGRRNARAVLRPIGRTWFTGGRRGSDARRLVCVVVLPVALVALGLVVTYPGSAAATASPQTIFPYQATGYKYLQVPSGQEPSGWQGSSFDDSSWATGDAAFGSGGSCPLQPTVKTHWDPSTDMLIRKPIVLPAGTSGVMVSVAVDNDVNVYWNGTLVRSATHEGCPAYNDFVFTVPDNLLVAGSNLLAVEGLDRGFESFLDVSVSGLAGQPPPNPPQDVVNTANATGEVAASWQPPVPNGVAVDHYNVVQIVSPPNTPGAVVATVPASQLSAVISGLHLCQYYDFGVQAVSTDGQISDTGYPPNGGVQTFGPPTSPPKVVVILANGLNTSIGSGVYDPILPAYSYCSSDGGDPASVQTMINNWKESSPPNVGTRLTDTLAGSGAVLLPFSVNGASLSGAATAPVFTFNGYTANDIGNTSPVVAAGTLNQEITSVHQVWGSAGILVVGHSEGGLISEDWWIKLGSKNPRGVTQVFSLDSPINGVAGAPIGSPFLSLVGVGTNLARDYGLLFKHQQLVEPIEVALDNKTHLFTPIGTWGDPIYDAGDWLASPPGQDNIGLLSQVYVSEPSCAFSTPPFDLTSGACAVVGQSFIDPCGPLPDGGPPLFGIPGDLYLHGVVKNCPGVITKIMSYVSSG